MPIDGSYLIPKSIYSCIPNPKFPLEEKLARRNSYSLTYGLSYIGELVISSKIDVI